MATLTTILADVRNRITDTTTQFWTDAMLTTWINDGLKDITRRAEVLETILTIPAVAGTREYNLQTAIAETGKLIYRLHRVEFRVTTTNIYTLEARNIGEMDSIWGINQIQQQSYPSFYTIWGIMGVDAKIYVYPTPSQAGTLALWCYKLPTVLASGSDVAEIPTGWENLIPLYCEYVALRRDSDSRWKDAKALYDESLESMIEMTRSHHDQQQWITTPANNVPNWWLAGNGLEY